MKNFKISLILTVRLKLYIYIFKKYYFIKNILLGISRSLNSNLTFIFLNLSPITLNVLIPNYVILIKSNLF